MRKIGTLEVEKHALRFWSYLKDKEISSSLEEEDNDSGWSIWISDEDKLDHAKSDFNEFILNPEDAKFSSSSPLTKKDLRHEKPSEFKTKGFKEYNLGKKWRKTDRSPGVFTLGLIIISFVVYLVSIFVPNIGIQSLLYVEGTALGSEYWRLITPIFVHHPIPLHLLCNMYWLYDLGSQIEKKKGSKFFITFVLLLAAVSNFANYLTLNEREVLFGMSGVVFGLFGYIWIKCKYDPAENFRLDSISTIIMFGFFIACFTGLMGNIANTAHATGLLLGIAWGYCSALRWNWGGR